LTPATPFDRNCRRITDRAAIEGVGVERRSKGSPASGAYRDLCGDCPLTRRRALAGFGLTEPDSGSDAAASRTRAELVGDEWVVNGAKASITNSGTHITSVVTVTARTGTIGGGDGSFPRSSTAFISRRARLDATTPGQSHRLEKRNRTPAWLGGVVPDWTPPREAILTTPEKPCEA